MNAQVLKAQPEDAALIALLGRITFAETFGHLFAGHRAHLLAYLDRTFSVGKIRRSIESSRNAYWLGFADGLPVSYAKLKYPSPTPLLRGESVAQLQKIYVLRDFLEQGIGKSLLQAILDHAANLQIEKLWLDVLKDNTRAILFYQRHGFSGLGEDTYTIGAQTFLFHLMTRRVGAEST